MRRNLFLLLGIVLFAAAFVGCSNQSNMNAGANANANTNMGTTSRGVPTATATPKYTEEQARQEREKAKANKETVGESLDDAWIHARLARNLAEGYGFAINKGEPVPASSSPRCVTPSSCASV